MRRVAILVAGSANVAFYSQLAVLNAAVRALPWRTWEPSIHVCIGGSTSADEATLHDWTPFLKDVDVSVIPAEIFRLKENWAQVDRVLELAPREADALIVLDADTLPVASLEPVLDQVVADDLVAGVIAHYPPPGIASRTDWLRLADGLIHTPLTFEHHYSLVDPAERSREGAPFYVNGGVMLFGRACFDRFVGPYLELRPQIAARMADAFSGQVAATFAIVEAGLNARLLPMRFNYPNDAIADRLYPGEAANVVIHHYLRTTSFDREQIFTTSAAFDRFLQEELRGPDLRFQDAVRNLFDSRYPFVRS